MSINCSTKARSNLDCMRVCEADVITLFYAFPVLKVFIEDRRRVSRDFLDDSTYEFYYRLAVEISFDGYPSAEATASPNRYLGLSRSLDS